MDDFSVVLLFPTKTSPREFLQFFDLDFSLAVFDPETNIGRDVQYRERTKLCSALGLTELTDPEVTLIKINQ